MMDALIPRLKAVGIPAAGRKKLRSNPHRLLLMFNQLKFRDYFFSQISFANIMRSHEITK